MVWLFSSAITITFQVYLNPFILRLRCQALGGFGTPLLSVTWGPSGRISPAVAFVQRYSTKGRGMRQYFGCRGYGSYAKEAKYEDTLDSTAILVVACRLEGRWEEAEQLFVQAIETSKTKLGPDHSLTLTSVANLAFTWESIGQHAKAIGLLRTCMEATTSFCPCCRMTIHF